MRKDLSDAYDQHGERVGEHGSSPGEGEEQSGTVSRKLKDGSTVTNPVYRKKRKRKMPTKDELTRIGVHKGKSIHYKEGEKD